MISPNWCQIETFEVNYFKGSKMPKICQFFWLDLQTVTVRLVNFWRTAAISTKFSVPFLK